VDPEKILDLVQSATFSTAYKEPSTVQELLNYWSPPPNLGLPALPAFSSEQILGPVRQRALAEQEEVARELGKASASELTPEDMHRHWGAPAVNHHSDRTFLLDGRKLGPDEWRNRPDFDWRKVSLIMDGNTSENNTVTGFVAPVPDQGNCGSCYAVAATSMLTARLMLRYPELYHQRFMDGDRISWHQQLDCNHYVQGCDGGYPLLISRWSMENDIVLRSCANAVGRHGGCKYDAPECREDRFRVRHFRYVGGAFGRCGSKRLCEAALREELYKGGPMVVSVEPTDDFSSFSGGVLHDLFNYSESQKQAPPADDKDCTSTECFTWRKIDHSMLLVGWGEDERYGTYCSPLATEEMKHEEECKAYHNSKEQCVAAGCHFGGFPYWIIQNSWTPNWGEDGYLLVGPRGQNPLMVEMMSVSADIVRSEELGNIFSLKQPTRHIQQSLMERNISRGEDDDDADLETPRKTGGRIVRVKHNHLIDLSSSSK
jgi:cathepsin C